MKKVCHIIFEHHPLDGRVFYKEAVSLARAGYEVILLVPTVDRKSLGRKKQIKLENDLRYSKLGVTFDIYYYNKTIPRQLGIRYYITKRRILNKLIEIDADIYHFHEDGLLLDACLTFKRKYPNKKIIFDFHEFFLISYLEKRKKYSFISQYLKKMWQLIDVADLIITVSPFITQYYKAIGAVNVETIMNCQSELIFAQEDDLSLAGNDFWVCHEGRMLFDRGLKLVIEIARYIQNPLVKIILIGDFPVREGKYFKDKAIKYNLWDRIIVTGWQHYEDVGRYLSASKVGLFFMLSRNGAFGIANKFFNYLRYGLPVISLDNSSTNGIIKKYKCGYIFSTNQAKQIAEKIDELSLNEKTLQKISRNSQKAFSEEYNWEIMEERLINAYKKL